MTNKINLDALTVQISAMLDMQNAMNSKVHPQWFEQNFEFYRAIWVECAEMLDHYGWKWWKHQQPDIAQVQLELVDIFHFGLSCKIIENKDLAVLASEIASEMQNPTSLPASFLQRCTLLVKNVRGFSGEAYFQFSRRANNQLCGLPVIE